MSDTTVQPHISVVIPAYNAQDVLPLQLQALDAQEGAPPFEVTVVDNNSTDDTAGVVSAMRHQVSYPLRLVTAHEHQGPGYARNVGAAHAAAELLMFTDADDIVSRWWLKNGRRAFENSVLWSGGARLMTDDEMVGGVEEIRRAAGDTGAWVDPTPGDLTNAFPVVMGCNFGTTRRTFNVLGGFDHSLGVVYEDNDFGVRAHLAGIPVDDAHAVRIAYRGKWDLRFRTRLARRSARAHAVVAARYGLRGRSPFPSPWTEVPRALGSAALMLGGRKRCDWPGVWMRLNTAVGHAAGRMDAALPGRRPAPQVGLGLDRTTREATA